MQNVMLKRQKSRTICSKKWRMHSMQDVGVSSVLHKCGHHSWLLLRLFLTF